MESTQDRAGSSSGERAGGGGAVAGLWQAAAHKSHSKHFWSCLVTNYSTKHLLLTVVLMTGHVFVRVWSWELWEAKKNRKWGGRGSTRFHTSYFLFSLCICRVNKVRKKTGAQPPRKGVGHRFVKLFHKIHFLKQRMAFLNMQSSLVSESALLWLHFFF